MTLLDEHRLTPNGHTEADALIEEARQRQRRRRLLIGSIVLVVAVASGIWAASGGGSATKPPSTSKKPGHVKSPLGPPSPAKKGTTLSAKPYALHCGAQFFDDADEAFITHWFGGMQFCLLSVPSKTWFDVVSREVGPQRAGGPVVLVHKCASGDTNCLDPNVTHALKDFTAYPAPDPDTAIPLVTFLPSSPSCHTDCAVPAQGATLLVIGGNCTGVFDLKTDKWYSDGTPSADQLQRGDPGGAIEILSAPSFPASQSPPPTPSPAPAACRLAG